MMTSFFDVVFKYDVFIFDLWGVVHNGKDLFPWTLKTLDFLKKEQKYIALLSNSPRLIDSSEEHLKQKGLTKDFYDILCTSGQQCHSFLKKSSYKKAFFIGPEHEKNLLKDLDIGIAESIEESDFILLCGLDGKPIDYFSKILIMAKELSLTMLCANPDRGAIFENTLIFSAGSLAQKYEEIGGSVVYFGKPHNPIYQFLFDDISKTLINLQKKDILCVGDSIMTDIKGAKFFGVDSALVLTGITKDQNFDEGIQPTYVFKDISI